MASYVLSFEDYTPSPRLDEAPWTSVRIEESTSRDGTFTPIDTIALDPLDTDPSDPQPRTFTTPNGTLAAGWYRVVFLDDANGLEETEPIYHSNARIAFLPTVAEVADHIRTRTKSQSTGREVGTFTDETRPTDEQVRRLILKADAKIAGRLGGSIPESLREQARVVTALRAAMFVELSYFGDQITAGRSPYTELKALHDEEFKQLIADWMIVGADGEPGSTDDAGPGSPAISYPAELAQPAPGSEVPQQTTTTSAAWREW